MRDMILLLFIGHGDMRDIAPLFFRTGEQENMRDMIPLFFIGHENMGT